VIPSAAWPNREEPCQAEIRLLPHLLGVS
jgi:hypothetical protein